MRGSPTPTGTDGPDGEVVEKGGAAQGIREDYLINAPLTGAASAADRKVLTCALSSSCVGHVLRARPRKFDLANITASQRIVPDRSSARPARPICRTSSTGFAASTTTATSRARARPAPATTSTIRGSVHGDVLHSRPQIVNYGGSDGHRRLLRRQRRHAARGVRRHQQRQLRGRQDRRAGNVDVRRPGNVRQVQAPARPECRSSGCPNVDLHRRLAGTAAPRLLLRRRHRPLSHVEPDRHLRHGAARRQLHLRHRRDRSRRRRRWCGRSTTRPPASPISRRRGRRRRSATCGPRARAIRCSFSAPGIAAAIRARPAASRPASARTPTPRRRGAELPRGRRRARRLRGRPRRQRHVDDARRCSSSSRRPGTTARPIGDSVAADVTLLDRDGDGYVDRVYAADMGGTVWRMDVDDASTTNWKLFKFAVAKQLADGSGYREKFLYRPDVVPTTVFDAVLIGSGNREDPLSTSTNNRFYMFKDFKTGKDASAGTPMAAISDYGTMLNAATADADDAPGRDHGPEQERLVLPAPDRRRKGGQRAADHRRHRVLRDQSSERRAGRRTSPAPTSGRPAPIGSTTRAAQRRGADAQHPVHRRRPAAVADGRHRANRRPAARSCPSASAAGPARIFPAIFRKACPWADRRRSIRSRSSSTRRRRARRRSGTTISINSARAKASFPQRGQRVSAPACRAIQRVSGRHCSQSCSARERGRSNTGGAVARAVDVHLRVAQVRDERVTEGAEERVELARADGPRIDAHRDQPDGEVAPPHRFLVGDRRRENAASPPCRTPRATPAPASRRRRARRRRGGRRAGGRDCRPRRTADRSRAARSFSRPAGGR